MHLDLFSFGENIEWVMWHNERTKAKKKKKELHVYNKWCFKFHLFVGRVLRKSVWMRTRKNEHREEWEKEWRAIIYQATEYTEDKHIRARISCSLNSKRIWLCSVLHKTLYVHCMWLATSENLKQVAKHDNCVMERPYKRQVIRNMWMKTKLHEDAKRTKFGKTSIKTDSQPGSNAKERVVMVGGETTANGLQNAHALIFYESLMFDNKLQIMCSHCLYCLALLMMKCMLCALRTRTRTPHTGTWCGALKS